MSEKTALDGVGNCGLHKRTPYGITNVSMTQFSIARHYGGIKFNGDHYVYLPDTDELIREDVLRWQKQEAKKRKAINENSDSVRSK